MAEISLPSSDDFRERFPEFDSIIEDDDVIDRAIADAALTVDDTWLSADIEPALLYLAAHYLTASRVASEQVEDGGPPIKSETIGRISTTYGDPASAALTTSSNYGARFEEIRMRNRSHGAII